MGDPNPYQRPNHDRSRSKSPKRGRAPLPPQEHLSIPNTNKDVDRTGRTFGGYSKLRTNARGEPLWLSSMALKREEEGIEADKERARKMLEKRERKRKDSEGRVVGDGGGESMFNAAGPVKTCVDPLLHPVGVEGKPLDQEDTGDDPFCHPDRKQLRYSPARERNDPDSTRPPHERFRPTVDHSTDEREQWHSSTRTRRSRSPQNSSYREREPMRRRSPSPFSIRNRRRRASPSPPIHHRERSFSRRRSVNGEEGNGKRHNAQGDRPGEERGRWGRRSSGEEEYNQHGQHRRYSPPPLRPAHYDYHNSTQQRSPPPTNRRRSWTPPLSHHLPLPPQQPNRIMSADLRLAEEIINSFHNATPIANRVPTQDRLRLPPHERTLPTPASYPLPQLPYPTLPLPLSSMTPSHQNISQQANPAFISSYLPQYFQPHQPLPAYDNRVEFNSDFNDERGRNEGFSMKGVTPEKSRALSRALGLADDIDAEGLWRMFQGGQ